MFAPTREAAAELNERAQGYMRQSGRLGERVLAGPRDTRFSEGDRVMCLENASRDVGVLNGQRGTVVEVEESTFSLRVQIDGGEEVVLPGSYVDEGNVGLGYAMTVHKSQGMTVDRAYVLGGEGLYGELAYTALSRHREVCRFYVNAGEVAGAQLETELAGEQRDEALEKIERTMGVSRAQTMALDVHETDEGQRQLVGQRVDGIVRITDRPKNAGGRAYLVEEGLTKMGELQALIDDYLTKAARLGYAPMQGWF